MKVLLVDDNSDLALNISDFLEGKGYIVDYAADGRVAYNLVGDNHYDVIVLDIGLPGIDGYGVCQKIRGDLQKDTPIIMLTARDTEFDKLKGFDVGTDDYLVKPFSILELEARIVALSKRRTNHSLPGKKIVVDDLEYDPLTFEVTRNGEVIYLMPVPLKILVMLMRNANNVVTRQQIELEIWNDMPPDSEVLRSHIYAIRNQIDRGRDDKLLKTIRGVGYKLVSNQ
jgi:DNA-binding response OmpR family regulator